jgi:hypothetical protein
VDFTRPEDREGEDVLGARRDSALRFHSTQAAALGATLVKRFADLPPTLVGQLVTPPL